MRKIDDTGKRFGSWVALREGPRKRDKRRYWCRCNCGAEKLVLADSLRNGRSKSCGCSRIKYADKGRGESAFVMFLNDYKHTADRRGLDWSIDEDLFRKITKGDCFYCGSPPVHEYHANREYVNGGYLANGLDRIDSSGTYEEGNVVPCCKECNMAKGKMFVVDFTAMCSRVHEHQNQWTPDQAFLRGSRFVERAVPLFSNPTCSAELNKNIRY